MRSRYTNINSHNSCALSCAYISGILDRKWRTAGSGLREVERATRGTIITTRVDACSQKMPITEPDDITPIYQTSSDVMLRRRHLEPLRLLKHCFVARKKASWHHFLFISNSRIIWFGFPLPNHALPNIVFEVDERCDACF